MNPQTITILIVVAGLVIWRRRNSMYRPIKGNGRRILIPLIFLLPAFSLLFNPEFQLPASEWAAAVVAGLLLSIPLILTTNYEVRGDGQIYAKKSIGFMISFVGLLLLRLFMRDYLSDLDPNELSAIFILVAVGYVIPWRVASYIKFRTVYTGNMQVAE
ncbi:cytochrome c biogenesis protein CcdC [Paenibacillus lignilyticus]|uniref:Cytochrome c biogenesis protein CcdC n=1 Tax=Paenibacillus lignilyticus TaxID=1172615 RepID=A0ABS5CD66_9BACL|nr:cytochrome c biogenesis protein CcdC [Paenibacillus lignilyticus]MBP3963891.1 cytochrome c biogenesis protein CcdC [Paenibacillus lignilyticus]